MNTTPYAFAPDFDVAWLREYAIRRAIGELNEKAWETLPWTGDEKPNLWLLRNLPWERVRTQRWFDYQGVVVSGPDRNSGAQLIQWRTNTVWGSLTMLSPEQSHRLEMRRETERAALQLRLLLLAWRHEHGELPESLDELEQAYPGKVPLNPATKQAWVYRPHGVAGESSLEQPFLWTGWPNYSGERTATPPSVETELSRTGTVFVIDPSELKPRGE